MVGTARPGLLSAEDPLAVATLGSRTQAREVAAGIRLAEALAEDKLAAKALFVVRLLLPVGAMRDEGRREKGHTEATQDARRTRLGHLLLVDRLHYGRGATTSGDLRPAELQPASLVQPPLPPALVLGLLFLAVAACDAVAPLRRQVAVEPASDLLPEGLLVGREAEIHG